jgi:hypothetical protein
MKKPKDKVYFNLYRFAMGWDWQAYRPEYEWFTLKDILSGKNEKWNQLVAKNPSLEKIVNHIQLQYQTKVNTFVERYGVSPEQVQDFYNMYVGYHPAYGAYMVGVGPYVGNKPEDKDNKFGYFTMRYPSTDSRNLLILWNKLLMGKDTPFKSIKENLGLDMLSSVVAPDDFLLQVRQRPDSAPRTESENYELIDMTPEFLEENNYQKAIDEGREPPYRTTMGIGSYFVIKPKGAFKLLVRVAERNGQEEQLKSIISSVAVLRGIPEDQIQEAAVSDYEFAKEVSEKFSEVNPLVKNLMETRRSGSQQTEALKPSREQTQMIKLMKEICEIVTEIGSSDPERVAQALNAKRPKKKGKAQGLFTPKIVTHWLEQIRFFQESHDANGNIESTKGYDEMIQEFGDNLVEMRQGFDDMETALKIASLRFAEVQSTEIDPVSRAKLVMIPSMFEMPTNVNMTSQDLTEMRFGEGFTQQDQEQQLVEETGSVQPEVEVEQVEVDKPSVKNVPQVDEEDEQEDTEEEQVAIARTLRALRKVANNLRQEGKSKSAFGIEQIIKKYQVRTML